MKINQSLEQATYVLVILALQRDQQPLKSRQLSQILQVSDSYLKKILQKLKHAGLIDASASKRGGYQLVTPLMEISLKDLFFALELNEQPYELNHLAGAVFPDPVHQQESEAKVTAVLDQALAAFYDRLAAFTLDQLVKPGASVDWTQQVQ